MAVWSTVQFQNTVELLRYDAEHYKPVYLENLRFFRELCPHPVRSIGSLLRSMTGGATPLGADYPNGGIPFLRVQNIMQGYLDLSDVVFISPKMHYGELARSQVRPGDVLLTITGMTYGKAAYVPDNFGPANINQHSVRMAFVREMLPEYVAMFLNSRFGKLQSDMYITGISRPALNYPDIQRILIPILPNDQQEEIRALVKQSEDARTESRQTYADAETLLADALGLNTLSFPTVKTFTASFRETTVADRLDADYFHPQKEVMLAHLRRLGGKRLRAYVKPIRQQVDPSRYPTDEPVFNFDLPHALSHYLSDDKLSPVPFGVLGSTKKRMRYGDVAISRLRAYLKEVAVVRVRGEVPIVGSSEFIVLRPQPGLYPEALGVFLRSPAVQVVLKWSQSGSAHPRFDEKDLLDIPLPSVFFDLQEEIAAMVEESINLDRQAAALLEQAKHVVETIILGA